ncbi:MAG: PocR ligand-binding domain-containing protein [Bacteroidales bacterium]
MKRSEIKYTKIEDVEFLDLFDIDVIQKLQDSFAAATGVASIITKPDGTPITRPSNFCRLCRDIIRNTEKGSRNCRLSDSILGRQNKNGPIYQKCLSGGLWDGGASISVGTKHIANWLIGQIKNEESDTEDIINYSKKIGVDEQEFRKALDEVTTMPLEQFKKIVDSLFIFANQLSEKAYQNYQLKIHKEHLELLVREKTQDLESVNEELKTINDELSTKNQIINSQNIELKSTLKHLKETQAQLLYADKMASLGILTAGVAHEINNPLNYIMGAYFGLENFFDNETPERKEEVAILLASLKEGVERAAAIVRGLNQFSRDSKNYDEQCHIHSIIDNCLAMLYNQYKHKIDIEKFYEKEDVIVKGNVGKLHQAFLNILTNSIQAIKDKGSISVSTTKNSSSLTILIADSGSGIKKEYLSKIMDPFFTTKDPGKGTGLGLSITYSIIQEHRGEIEFESEINKGTTVKITLPIT